MPSILPLLLATQHELKYDYSAAAAAVSLVFVCHMMSNVANTLFDFKTGAISLLLSRPCALPPPLHFPIIEQVSTRFITQTTA
jgi:hypothetical protein